MTEETDKYIKALKEMHPDYNEEKILNAKKCDRCYLSYMKDSLACDLCLYNPKYKMLRDNFRPFE